MFPLGTWLWIQGGGDDRGIMSEDQKTPWKDVFPPCLFCPSSLLLGIHVLSLWGDFLIHLPTQDW